ncbi:MAG: N-6 DNA methylase [Caldilineaceae bacterium]|nr:N-6 DNA methylase [Caldilineaceae bacterium]
MTQQSGTQQDLIQTILQDSGHHRSLFDVAAIERLQSRAFDKTVKGKKTTFVRCILRNKDVQLKPDEVVRQLYADRLINHYGYQHKRLAFEHAINIGRQKKKADIVIFDKDKPDTEFMIIELKRSKLLDGKNQLRSYCNATGAPIGVWTNGQQISRYHRKAPNYFEEISDIPSEAQSLEEIISERFTLKDLYLRDKLVNERKSLKEIILELEDEVLANAGVNVFEEVFKLIFTKLFDEVQGGKDKYDLDRHVARQSGDKAIDYETRKQIVATIDDSQFRSMEFRNTGQTDAELKRKIQRLFNQAKERWHGVFTDRAEFELSDSHLAVCVASLQDVKLFHSNLIVVDDAFEYLVNKSSKGEGGLYFTPRHVIDMCVKMLNPKKGEYMIDTAAGSCGFPVHTIFQLTGQLLTNPGISEEDKEHAHRVFGIEFDEKTVRVARTLNLIAGDGQSNVLHLNTLDYERWSDRTEKDRRWISTYDRGFARLEELRAEPDQNKNFNFDILMASPPFAGNIKESRLLHQYALGFNAAGKLQPQVGRDILFIERNLDFLKPGGRMAIVLPQGRFNGTTDKHVRDFIAEHARILAVVGLHGNTFKPHTGTKTSVLFLQKWNNDAQQDSYCPHVDDYPIFFAVSEKGGKDNSGDYIYIRSDDGQYALDKNNHMIVDHDLHNQDGELCPGIAEAFVEWAKCEGLSFWREND